VRIGFAVAGFAGIWIGTALRNGPILATAEGVVGGVLLTRVADAFGDPRIKKRLWLGCLLAAGVAYFARSPGWFYAAWSALVVTRVYMYFVMDQERSGLV
jgi:hypothetical protein